MMKKKLSFIAIVSIFIGMGMLTGCKGNTSADLVVYGKIFTSENNQIVEAFAVKDGKYVYVGDKAGAEAFVEEGKTEVVDYSGKGLVMPGCGNGHAHYASGYAIQTVGTMISMEDDVNKFMTEIVPATVKKAKDTGAKAIFGCGWNMLEFSSFLVIDVTTQVLLCRSIGLISLPVDGIDADGTWQDNNIVCVSCPLGIIRNNHTSIVGSLCKFQMRVGFEIVFRYRITNNISSDHML